MQVRARHRCPGDLGFAAPCRYTATGPRVAGMVAGIVIVAGVLLWAGLELLGVVSFYALATCLRALPS